MLGLATSQSGHQFFPVTGSVLPVITTITCYCSAEICARVSWKSEGSVTSTIVAIIF